MSRESKEMKHQLTRVNLDSVQVVEQFLEKTVFNIPKGFKPYGNNIGCVDGRAKRGPGTEEQIALPGSGLGVYLAAFATLDVIQMRENFPSADEIKRHVAEEINKEIGVSLHTDQHNEAGHNPLACGGCGHCAGILNSPNLVTDSFLDFIKREYLRQIKEEGVKPVVYEGEHMESAVLISNDPEIGIVSQTPQSQAFVYNLTWHMQILDKVAGILFDCLNTTLIDPLKDHSEEVQRVKNQIHHDIMLVAQKQLDDTLGRLAFGKPVFMVEKSENGFKVTEVPPKKQEK